MCGTQRGRLGSHVKRGGWKEAAGGGVSSDHVTTSSRRERLEFEAGEIVRVLRFALLSLRKTLWVLGFLVCKIAQLR